MNRILVFASVLAAAAFALSPIALGSLSGSGNVTDYVQLTVTTGALPSALTSTAATSSGGIANSGSNAFHVTNEGSNVDTFFLLGWATVPYYGSNSGSTSINIRGTTHYISDLLWFRQEMVSSAAALTTSEYWSPLVLKSASDVQAASFTSSGNACTAWVNNPGGLTLAAAGTFTFKYYTSSTNNDAPTTSNTFHYCLDTTNSRVYLNSAADFTGATRLDVYTTNSANAVLNTYQYEAKPTGITTGNRYCLAAISGSGTSASPELRQCQKMPYELPGTTANKVYVLFDPPNFFPSVNQGGTITFATSGIQWNPYASSTTNSA